MGAVSSAIEGCFSITEDPSESGSRIVFRPLRRHTSEATNLTKDASRIEDDGQGHKDSATPRHCILSLDDFTIMRSLGKGSFGKVYLVRRKGTNRFYAIKAMKKKDLLMKNMLQCTLNEKNILKEVEHPFVVQLKYSFQSKVNVFMVMDLCTGGDLAARLKKENKFDDKTVKVCAAEIVLALEYLHENLNVIHRDIKPENILIGSDGHLKISDFGLAKTTRKALTLCGTAEYLAPEIITCRAYGQEVDWWSLGCLIYQMLDGQPPFSNERQEKLIEQILTENPGMPLSFSSQTKDLLANLLNKNPKQRLGAKGAWEVKKHPFFKGIDWSKIMTQKLAPPFRPTSLRLGISNHNKVRTYVVLNDNGEKNISNGSTLEPQHLSHESDSFDFPQFSYTGKDGFIEEIDVENK